ncbi:MAG: proline--tRNA ligase [Solirubrobacterales bacterium]
MTRFSEALIPTLRESPADAEATSHKLLVRAGMVRQLGAGLWTFLPAGWRVHSKVERIIREEMDAIGGQEMLMPVLQPADLWAKTGRLDIEELFKLEDRKGSDLVLAMTHEEAITAHVASEVRSWRDLPKLLYQLQVKERDEPRPRAGILRTREFVMKDAYSFDRDEEGLNRSYEACIGAYDRILDRCGLSWYRVASDVGMMGGQGAHEYMAPCPAGEDEVAISAGYAANVDVATGTPELVELPEAREAPVEVETPGLTTVEEVAGALGVSEGALIKAVPFTASTGEVVLALVRGDDEVNPVLLGNAAGLDLRPSTEEEIGDRIGPPGFIGPIGTEVRVIKDSQVAGGGLVCGANAKDRQLKGVEPGRDFIFEKADIRRVREGDSGPDGSPIRLEPAIEIGNIFKLGTRYSEALGATFLDEDGAERPIVMGSYGIGPARIVAALAEQGADEAGLSWPASVAPWQVEVVALGKGGDEAIRVAEDLYRELQDSGVEVLFDDREAGAGQKLTDAELIGCPLRIVVGRKGVEAGELEASWRASGDDFTVPLDQGVAEISQLVAETS